VRGRAAVFLDFFATIVFKDIFLMLKMQLISRKVFYGSGAQ
jgi:hypothetical protein